MIPSILADSYENDESYEDIQSMDQFINIFSKELYQKGGFYDQNTKINGSNPFFGGSENFAFSTNDSDDMVVYDAELTNAVKSIFKDQFSKDQIQRLSNSLSDILDQSFQQTAELYRPKRPKRNRYPNNFPMPSIGFVLPQPQVLINSDQPPPDTSYPYQINKPFQIQNPLQMNSIQNLYMMQNLLQMNSIKNQLQMNGYSIRDQSLKKDKKKKKDSKKKKDKKSKKDNEKKCDGGIFRFLFDKYKQGPIKEGVVDISSQMIGGSGSEISLLKNLINPNINAKHWTSKNTENSFIEITFKNMFVLVNKYLLKVGFQNGDLVFRSWILTGTTEDGKQVTLDEVDETNSISKEKPEATFEVKTKSYVKSLRLTMRKRNGFNYQMAMRNIELFGKIKFVGE